jgi:hypothetical protein
MSSLEVESEMYIFCCDVYLGFDRSRSSIVPYLERQLPWHAKALCKRIDSARLKEEPSGLIRKPIDTTINESFYSKDLILNNSSVGKCFTRGQKYLIYVILTADDKELSQRALAKTLNVDVRCIRKMIYKIRRLLTEENNAKC